MSQPLNVHLLGTLRVHAQQNEAPLDLGAPKTRALFAYLVLNHEVSIDRRRLAFLFWPRGTEVAARRNLRQYLHRIRRVLEPIDADGRFISTEGHYIQFQPPPDWFLDVAAFEKACTPPDEDLEYAVSLYQGDLLPDFYDDWVVPERERLARLFRQSLLQLIDKYEANGQLHEAISFAQRYCEAEPLLESAYVRLMRLHYFVGDRGRIRQLQEQLVTTLRDELNTQPLAETEAMITAMLAGAYLMQPQAIETAVFPSPMLPPPASPALSPLSETAALDVVPHIDPPFIGKNNELNQLHNAYQAATAVAGSFQFIQGEIGIGKTRLLNEWITQIKTDKKVLPFIFSGRCHEFEAMIPYAPLAQALQSGMHTIPWELFLPPPVWLGSLRSLLPDLSNRLNSQQFDWPPSSGQHHLVEGMGNLFLTLARHRPVVLTIDNLHWADTPTWNFLGYLAQRAVRTRILIVGTTREGELTAERNRFVRKLTREQLLHKLPMTRLSKPETSQLMQKFLELHKRAVEPLESIFVNRVFEETEGNPFFVVETLRAVMETGQDWTVSLPTDAAGNRPAFAIPLQVQSIIESRLDKLSEESRTALGVAAAIGREFSFDLLQAASLINADTLLNALDEWLARGMVRETADGYDFTHEKLSQVAYERMSRARRQWVHFQIADYLHTETSDADPAQLAHHYYLSNKPATALPYLAQAGQRALAVHSYPEAKEFGLRAIGLIGRFPNITKTNKTDRIDLNVQLAQAYAFTGNLDQSLKILQETERVAETLGDIERLAHIFYRSSQIFWLLGHVGTANKYAARTLRHAEELQDDSLRFAAIRMQGRAGLVLGDFDDAIAYFLRYVDLAARDQRPGLPVVYGYLGVAYARVGSWQRAIDAAQKGFDQANIEQSGSIHVVARMQLAFVYAELQEWRQALAIAEPVQELWREEGLTPHLFMLRAVIGRSLAHIGKPEAGIREIREAMKWAQEVDYRVLRHVVYCFLAQALFQGKQFEAAMETAVSAATQAAQTGDRWAEAVALRTQAEIGMKMKWPHWQVIENQLIRARDILRQIRARPDLARTYLAMRRLYDRAGQIAWAVDCHFRATSIFEELGMEAEHKTAQGQAAGERTGAVVISGLDLRGPNFPAHDNSG